jgi:restriction system protein
MTKRPGTIRPSGGYRRLRSFQVAEIIYDGTVSFCDRFVNKRSRTHDPMVQAAQRATEYRRGAPSAPIFG